MPLKMGQVRVSLSVKLLLPTAWVALLALKAPPKVDEGGRVGPRQENWAHKDGDINQCNNKVGCGNKPSGGGCQL
jgi:hypothetical protein